MVKNHLLMQGVGSIPARGTKIPCATWQLSLHATTRELACRNENQHSPKGAFPASKSKMALQWRQGITAQEVSCYFFVYYPKPKLYLDSLQITHTKSNFSLSVNSSLIVFFDSSYNSMSKKNQKMGRRTK